MASLSIIETDQIATKVHVIMRQTDYTEEIANEKLKECNFDEIKVLKNYFGIQDKQPVAINSVNQEIYKQIRHRLDSNMRDYRERVDRGEVKKVL